MIMENDTDAIKKMGEKMMGDFTSKPKSAEVSESKEKGMFEMPSFGGEEKASSGHDCSCDHESHKEQAQQKPKSDSMFGDGAWGAKSGGQEQSQPKSDDMFGGGFGSFGGEPQGQPKSDSMFGGFGGEPEPKGDAQNNAFGSNDDADKLKELGKRMMG
jgi:hypothetical protein